MLKDRRCNFGNVGLNQVRESFECQLKGLDFLLQSPQQIKSTFKLYLLKKFRAKISQLLYLKLVLTCKKKIVFKIYRVHVLQYQLGDFLNKL